MIRLDVEHYCDNCLDFKPDVQFPEKYYFGDLEPIYLDDTIIRCENRNRCKNLVRHLERRLKGEENEVVG